MYCSPTNILTNLQPATSCFMRRSPVHIWMYSLAVDIARTCMGRKTTPVSLRKNEARGKYRGLWSLLLLRLLTYRHVTGFLLPSGRVIAREISLRRTLLVLTASSGSDREDFLPPLSPPIVELITPDGCSSQSSADVSKLVHNVKSAVTGGVKLVQLRDRKSDRRSISELASRLRDATRNRAWFVVNDGPDAARACGADGVHLPERRMDRLVDLSVSEEWPKVIGCSVHSAEAAVNAARLGANYLQVGTMFATSSHPGKVPEGVGLLSDVRRHLDAEELGGVLLIGVGGIDRSNCGMVAAAGGDGVAAIRCLCDGADPEGEALGILKALEAPSFARDVL